MVRVLIAAPTMSFYSLVRRSRLLALGPIAAALLHSETAAATSPPCEPFRILGASVVDGETSVPRDARLLVSYEGCGEKADVVLLRDGVPVESDLTHGGFGTNATWTSVKPRVALDANASYVLKAAQRDTPLSIAFTTGDALAFTNTARPTVRIGSSSFTSAADPSGFATATLELELSPALPMRGGVLFLDRAAANPADVARGAYDFAAKELAFDRGEPSAHVKVYLATRPGDPICFSGTYEDEAGRSSDPTEATCGVVSGEPLAAPAPTAADSSDGCSTSPRSTGSGSALVVIAAVLVASRRRKLARR